MRILAVAILVLALAGCAGQPRSAIIPVKSSAPTSVAPTNTPSSPVAPTNAGLPSPSATDSMDFSATASSAPSPPDVHVLTYELSTDKETAVLADWYRGGDPNDAANFGNMDPLLGPGIGWTQTVTVLGPLPYGSSVLQANTSTAGPIVTCTVLVDGKLVVTQSVDGSSQYQYLSCALPSS